MDDSEMKVSWKVWLPFVIIVLIIACALAWRNDRYFPEQSARVLYTKEHIQRFLPPEQHARVEETTSNEKEAVPVASCDPPTALATFRPTREQLRVGIRRVEQLLKHTNKLSVLMGATDALLCDNAVSLPVRTAAFSQLLQLRAALGLLEYVSGGKAQWEEVLTGSSGSMELTKEQGARGMTAISVMHLQIPLFAKVIHQTTRYVQEQKSGEWLIVGSHSESTSLELPDKHPAPDPNWSVGIPPEQIT